WPVTVSTPSEKSIVFRSTAAVSSTVAPVPERCDSCSFRTVGGRSVVSSSLLGWSLMGSPPVAVRWALRRALLDQEYRDYLTGGRKVQRISQHATRSGDRPIRSSERAI